MKDSKAAWATGWCFIALCVIAYHLQGIATALEAGQTFNIEYRCPHHPETGNPVTAPDILPGNWSQLLTMTEKHSMGKAKKRKAAKERRK